jgi:hypothetical protein
MLKDFKLVSQAGAWYTYTDTATGEEIKFQSKDFQGKLLDQPGMRDQIYNAICDKYILNYRAGEDFGVDDIIIDTEFEGEES